MRMLAFLCALAALGTVVLNIQKTDAKPEVEEYILVVDEKQPVTEHDAPQEQQEISILLKTNDGVREIPMEEYLVGVILSEMPPSFEETAFMAQAVAARTFAARNFNNGKHNDCTVCTNAGCCQAWRSENQLRRAFGTAYEQYVQKAITAIEKTAGEVLCYEGELIEAVYYSCSGGRTEPAVAVWGTDVPYLQTVASPGEENTSKFTSQVRVPFERFRKILQSADSDVSFPVIPEDWLGKVTYSAGGGVKTMILGGVSFTGTKLRSLFSLASTLFTLSVGDGEMVFSVKGYGHRVGMSQYGANAMALDGAGYREILRHYYKGVAIKKLSRMESGQFCLLDTD